MTIAVSSTVMAGLVPAIHDFLVTRWPKQAVDARHKAGHDGVWTYVRAELHVMGMAQKDAKDPGELVTTWEVKP